MLILLPPSESKHQPVRGQATDLAGLTGAGELTEARTVMREALIELSGRVDAADILGLGPRLLDELTLNAHIDSLPAGAASTVYTGVLYAAAQLDQLAGVAKRRASQHVRIMSALYGVVLPKDRICAYRLGGSITLPGIGLVNRFWKDRLDPVLDPIADGGVVIDCRSGAYLPFWTPTGESDWVHVGAVQPKGGKLAVVSHWAKHHRGVFTHHLLTREGPVPKTAEDTLNAALELVDTHPDLTTATLTRTPKATKLTFHVSP